MEYIEYIALYTVSIASNLQPLLIFNRGFFMLGGQYNKCVSDIK